MSAERSAILSRLLRAIALSEGEFALLLARCNSSAMRDQIVAGLRSHLGNGLYVWQATPEAGVINLVEILEAAPEETQAACVTGLETSPHLNDILAIANNAREEFRRRFRFPLVLWVTDEVEARLRRQSPDLASWAAPAFVFALDQAELQAILERETEDIVERVFSRLGKRSTDQDLQGVWQEWQRNGASLSPEVEARIALLLGIEAGSSEAGRDYLEQCLSHFHTGALAAAAHYRLGLWWQQHGKQHRAEFLACFERACEQLQQAWQDPDGKHPQVALALGEVLLALALSEAKESGRWQAIAAFASQLPTQLPLFPALACGLRAEVALVQQDYPAAKREAEQALRSGDPEREAWHRLSLGRSLLGMSQAQAAIAPLEQAKAATPPELDPDLHIRILRSLHQAYTDAGDYRQAFAVKCDRQAVEAQYGFRAFIGAGQLRPQRQLGDIGEGTTEEIAASGRQTDIDDLMERVRRSDCRLTVIHGPSGVGKSSLLRAGLVPALRKLIHQSRSVVPVVVEQYEDWQRELATQLGMAENSDVLETSESWSERLINQLRENDRRHQITVLIFDQFEEFFFKHLDIPGRRQWYDFLRDCLNVPFVWVMLSLREDYVHYLLECDRLANLTLINNDILNKNVRYYLGNFDPERAKAVIRELTERSPYRLQPDLIDRLTVDLAADLGEVRPIELQVVGAQMLQSDARITTLAAYTALGDQPKQVLVEGWLSQVVQDCGQENDRELARRVLVALTEEPEKRPVKTQTELSRDVSSSDDPDPRLLGEIGDLGDLEFVLTVLVGSGLAFEVPATPAVGYQLIHDYLVQPIRRQFGVKLAQQLEEERRQRTLAEENLKKRNRWLLQGSIIAALIFAVLGATALGFALQANEQKTEALKQKKEAETQRIIAENQTQIATNQTQIATNQTKVATDSAAAAKREKTEADKQRKLADLKRIEADKERNRTEQAGKAEQAQRKIAEEKAGIAQRAEAQAKDLAEKNRLDALNTRAVADSLYWKGLMDIKLLNLEEQVAVLEKARGWQRHLSGLRSDSRMELLSTLLRISYVPKEKFRFQGYQDFGDKAVFAPDGQTILTCKGNTVKLWTLDGRLLKTFRGHQYAVWSVAFAPDGKSVLTGSDDKTAKLWSLDGRLLKTFQGHQSTVWSVTFAPDGKSILTGSGDKTAKLWSLDGQVLQTFQGHEANVHSVAFAPDGKSILTGSVDNTAKLWSLDGRLLKTFQGHQYTVWSVTFAPDGKSILTGSGDKTAKLWSLDGQVLQTFQGHNSQVESVAFAPDGKSILTGSDDNTAKLWSLDGQVLQTFQGHNSRIESVAFAPDGKSILTSSFDSTVKLWSLDGLRLQTFKGHRNSVSSVTFAPDGKTILTGSGDNTARLWSLNGRLIQTFAPESLNCYGLSPSSCNYISSVAFAPDGKSILTGSYNNTAKLWSLDGQVLQTFKGHGSYVSSVAFAPDGKSVLTGSWDGTAKLWSRDGRVLQTLNHFLIYGVAFAPDGKTILTGGHDKTAKLWSFDGRLLQTFSGHQSFVNSVAFAPDGKTILTGSHDKTAKLWSFDGRLLQTFQSHQDFVWSVAFAPDGKSILTGSDDKTAKLWSLDGRLLQTFSGHQSSVWSVAFAPDGKSILTGSADKTVKLWDLDLSHSLAAMCNHLHNFAASSSNPDLPEDSRQLRERARLACEGIPPPKSIQVSNSTSGNSGKSSWWQDIISASF